MGLSPYIITIVASWVAAQGAKYIIIVARSGDVKNFRHLYLSGNMPSAHSATVVSMTTIVGLIDGIDSAAFGISLLLAVVVMYDAMMVRRSVGEQGEAIHTLIQQTNNKTRLPHAAKGHTPVEVAVGAFLGVVIGTVVYIATR